MTLLVFGDPHLTSPTVPGIDVDPAAVDFVIVVGDLLDRRCRSPEVGTDILADIAGSIAPVGYVPGNHDYPHRDAFSAVDGVTDLTPAYSRDGVRFVGLGCDRFDAGAEVQYLNAPFNGDADQVDEWLDTDTEGRSPIEAGTDSARSSVSAAELQRYGTRLRQLRSGLETAGGPHVLVSHVPPFNTPVDVIQEKRSPLQGHHWGSLAVRHALREYSPHLCLCGHIHGAAGVVDVEGTLCVNPGYRGAKRVKTDSERVRVADVDITYE